MIGSDWTGDGFDLPALAARTGPFPGRRFLAAWWAHRARPDDELRIVTGGSGLIPTVERDGTVGFAGEPDLTDYHSPLGEELTVPVEELAAAVTPGTPFRFDSLPGEAVTPMVEALEPVATGLTHHRHEVAAVLPLPPGMDAYLDTLSRKQRHETRRKHRRFVEVLGEPVLHRTAGADAVADFAAMHARSAGDKGGFFTPEILAFFEDLHTTAGAVIDVLTGDGSPVAAAFGFEDVDTYYLYNSAYAPEAATASPGVVLVTSLIERAIGEGRSRLDFLKGDEPYKFRLGAEERPLHAITGRFGRRGTS